MSRLKRIKVAQSFLIALLVVALTPGIAVADDAAEGSSSFWPNVFEGGTASFGLRLRGVRDDNGFEATRGEEAALLTQLRAGLDWQPVDALKLVFNIQDARVLGNNNLDLEASPNTNADSIDFHEFYLSTEQSLSGIPFSLSLGRQKLSVGSGRMLGDKKWTNTGGFLFDGASVHIGESGRSMDFYGVLSVGVNPTGVNLYNEVENRFANNVLYGVYYEDSKFFEGHKIDLYAQMRSSASSDDSVLTLGAAYNHKLETIIMDLEFAAQFGKYDGRTHRASMINGTLTYPLEEGSFGVSYTLATGDSDSEDDLSGGFDPGFGDRHKFLGMMDYFQLRNVQCIKFDSYFHVTERLRVFGDAYLLKVIKPESDDWLSASGAVMHEKGSAQEAGGVEFDVGLRYVLDKIFVIEVAHGIFSKEPEVDGTGAGSGFTYIQFISDF